MAYFEVLYLHLLENLRKVTKVLVNAADLPSLKQNLGTPKYAAGVLVTFFVSHYQPFKLKVFCNISYLRFHKRDFVFFLTRVSVYLNSMLIKIQPDATVCRYLFTAKSLYMFRVSQHPSSGVI